MEPEQEQPDRERVLPSVERSLAALQREQPALAVDQGARSLAIRYAQLLDGALPEQKWTRALRLVSEAVSAQADGLPPTAADQLLGAWDRISAALAEHSTASDLGPKLLATLTALGCTPAAKSDKGGKGAHVIDHPASGGLALIRGRADQRNGRSGTAG